MSLGFLLHPLRRVALVGGGDDLLREVPVYIDDFCERGGLGELDGLRRLCARCKARRALAGWVAIEALRLWRGRVHTAHAQATLSRALRTVHTSALLDGCGRQVDRQGGGTVRHGEGLALVFRRDGHRCLPDRVLVDVRGQGGRVQASRAQKPVRGASGPLRLVRLGTRDRQ
ncbi:uncharacterized protein SCHCODRAFT_01320877 [Schizophyllum commune H4-8]|uniref:uncharacterized protein n=1 Tax=Schizophyllum commune (strain H4-8 / FGSC 9210) TaxID=578458 RepID=UPI0021605379|nr:uncharacterized protein SCHCODRAFT_01320877 [Schizophyllum commune H4-8]KAI5890775.1 hypothetical protein SCHCODRAFT_01320877 [Schizophyllum commune H4-8]